MNQLSRFLCGVLFFLSAYIVQGQSPHGPKLKISCDACHSADSWVVNTDSIFFNHDTTRFVLEGQHSVIDCRQCHTTLEFSPVETNCVSCHLDIHQQSVGKDCSRCHDSNSWLVSNIAEVHRQISFPLLGAHAVANCSQCHTSETELRFEPMDDDCFSCHQTDYQATTNPDHENAGYSTNCIECHKIDAFEWTGIGINHDFFPLTQGHEINDCARCHTGPDYSSTSPDCITCHNEDFLAANNPNHQTLHFSTSCATCHTTQPGWKPAEYKEHDEQYFPIYSGSHKGVWDNCTDCHTDPNNYANFTCISCHTNPGTDNEHNEVSGYAYNNSACLACHPTGRAEGAFDHNKTNFQLTGAHTNVECLSCHANGYAGTPTECVACHVTDYDQTNNPKHSTLGLSTDCASCHTTVPEWNPARFPNHNDFYPLNGAHAIIAEQCVMCHNGDYNNTPSTCVGCHQSDYNQTTNPSHTALNYSTDCVMCHSETAWVPASNSDHDAQYFPIYSGAHDGVWEKCSDCHIDQNNFSIYTCITCHANPETNQQHSGVNGYVYENTACLACHPTGDADGSFDHDQSNFPLTGAHTTVDCIQCHTTGYEGTPTACNACHAQDFNQATNPNHQSLGLSTDCAICHTTAPGWNPAAFPNHTDFYPLHGAHASIANQCATCHNGNYINTPNTCAGCHQDDYNQTNDPNHQAAQFPTTCQTCHSENNWSPANWNHDDQYFPIYKGKHKNEWNQCSDCHTNPTNFSVFTCITCHKQGETNGDHNGVQDYQYNSAACLSCHPDGSE